MTDPASQPRRPGSKPVPPASPDAGASSDPLGAAPTVNSAREPPQTGPKISAETFSDEIRELIQAAGGEPENRHGRNVRDMIVTSLRMLRDGSDTGEVKLVNRATAELRHALTVFRPYHETPKISIYGSARTPEDHIDYRQAVDLAKDLAADGWMVITGAGDGIMRAGHGGAGRAASFGVSIRLPFETSANDLIIGDPKLVSFKYFFTRKLVFMWMSHAIALLPGGFGTMDEGFEALTLIQTGKAPMVPIVMVDAPGSGEDGFWARWDRFIRGSLLDNGWISPEDTSLYFITDSPAEAADHVRRFYANYHSQRFVGDRMVLRIREELSESQLDALNAEFPELVADGRIEQSGPLEGEIESLELPRLSWLSTKRANGRLRMLIDRINDAATG
ncbi:LOG family protein [Phycisphaera mikurensis]|uniref:AMP nucleosidase n=1 Tax=Phycisphaera mikurensis (strain NBRC 102666 / KCTC 22515 / FYK2301M01) TaxID=1142394 RepID=I0IEB1_PHYMF|nr:LOG family protein [Phycisphaera mikurensis]MBB6441400.1 hypothetical protein [Phycisphaera mikurensis]BAM03599.1 hypothetical protein PSMK_14400 [Phycisphaera mikurensis NBRC 102666]